MKLAPIFAVFLGLVLTAFVGVGVYTFYPAPTVQADARIRELTRDQDMIRGSTPMGELPPADRARIQALRNDINALQERSREDREVWGRNTSIILIVFSTLLMAIALLRADALPVLNHGLLIGGILTMIYGVGWIVATNTSIARFVVMAVALAITMGLGYARFARMPAPTVAAKSADTLSGLEQRVAELEKRMDDAASALRRNV